MLSPIVHGTSNDEVEVSPLKARFVFLPSPSDPQWVCILLKVQTRWAKGGTGTASVLIRVPHSTDEEPHYDLVVEGKKIGLRPWSDHPCWPEVLWEPEEWHPDLVVQHTHENMGLGALPVTCIGYFQAGEELPRTLLKWLEGTDSVRIYGGERTIIASVNVPDRQALEALGEAIQQILERMEQLGM